MRCQTLCAVLVLGLLVVFFQPAQAQPAGSTDATGAARSTPATQPAAKEPGTMPNKDDAKSKPAASQPAQGNPKVVLQTSMGKIVIELFAGQGPDHRRELPEVR